MKKTEMRYGDSGQCVLARGVYRGFEYVALNNGGAHPCGYVNVGSRRRELENDDGTTAYSCDKFSWVLCHGGVTYARPYLPDVDVRGYWIGWDYGHQGDFVFVRGYSCFDGKKWKTEQVVDECERVIDQLKERIEKNERELNERRELTAGRKAAFFGSISSSNERVSAKKNRKTFKSFRNELDSEFASIQRTLNEIELPSGKKDAAKFEADKTSAILDCMRLNDDILDKLEKHFGSKT